METTLQRLKIFIDYKKFNISRFEKHVGFSNGSLASQIKNNKTIGVDKIENILKKFPELSSDWLLKGQGEMVKISEFPTNPETQFTKRNNASSILRPSQIFKLEDYYNKLLFELRNVDGPNKDLFTSIEFFESFRDFVEDFSNSYNDSVFDKLFDERRYLTGKNFDYENYRKSVLIELEKLSNFRVPLLKLVESIKSFYEELRPFDTKKIIKSD